MKIAQNNDGTLFLSQPGYTKEILSLYKPKTTYMTPCTADFMTQMGTGSDESNVEKVDKTVYLSKLMKLFYLANRTRYDILSTLSILTTKMQDPNVNDMKRLDRVIGYIAFTPEFGIHIVVNDASLHAYFDAAWAVHTDLKGHSGIYITMGHNGFPLLAKSIKQKTVSRSSTEAELIAMFEGLDYLLWLRDIHIFIGYPANTIVIFQDNTSSITLAYMGRTSSRSNSKYMMLKYFYIKEYLDNNIVTLRYLPTEQMIADFFASPRVGKEFRTFRELILNCKTDK